MVSVEKVIKELINLKNQIDNISSECFKRPEKANQLKRILEKKVNDIINFIKKADSSAFNSAELVLTRKIRRILNPGRRISWIRELKFPIPEILASVDDLIADIESLFENPPPHAIIKINGIEIGQIFESSVDTPLEFDASESWDEDGTVIKWEWNFGDGTRKAKTVAVSHAFTKPGKYRVTLHVSDDGKPAETDADWVEINIK